MWSSVTPSLISPSSTHCATLLFLGRVATGTGGQLIIDKANEVLSKEFPELAITLCVPDEKTKRHGQAVAAASLPKLG